MIPQTCDIERMKAGGEHWQWDSEIPFYIGVLPRHGAKGSDVKVRGKIIWMLWISLPNGCLNSGSGHQTRSRVTQPMHMKSQMAPLSSTFLSHRKTSSFGGPIRMEMRLALKLFRRNT